MQYRKYSIERTAVKRRRVFPLIIIAVCAVVTVVFLYMFFATNIFVDRSSTLLKASEVLPEECVGTQNNILYLTDGKLTCIDLEGNVKWSTASDAKYDRLQASDSVISLYCDMGAVFFDYDATPLFILDMESQITGVSCGKDVVGVMVTQKEEADSSSFFHIYDHTGKELSTIDFTSKHILKSGIYGDSDIIYVLSLDTTGVVPMCYITTYKSDGTITGSISVNTQLLDNVIISDSQIFASGTNSLTSYSYFGEQQKEALIYGWEPYDSYVSGSDVMMMYTARGTEPENTEGLFSIKVLDESFNETMIYFPEAANYICCSESRIYAFGEMNIYVYNIQGEQINTIELTSPIVKAKSLGNGYAIVEESTASYILKLS